MKKTILRFMLALVFINAAIFSVNANALVVLTICDSITQGLQRTSNGQLFGKLTPGNGAANIGGYQPVLNQLLDAKFGPSTVYNWGIGGELSSQTVNRINSVLNSRPADYILILCGANDVLHGISSNTTKANMAVMVDRSLAKGVTPVVAELTPITTGSYDFSVWSAYNPKLRQVAADKNVPLAYMFGKDNNAFASAWVSDLRRCWRGGPICNGAIPYHSGDQLHLSNFGYTKMADIWFEVIRESEGGNIVPSLVPLLLD